MNCKQSRKYFSATVQEALKKPFSGPAHLIMLSESNSSGNSSNLQRNQHFNLILIKIFPKKVSSIAPWRLCRHRRNANATLSWQASATRRLLPLHKSRRKSHTILRNGHSTGNFRSCAPPAPERYGQAVFCKRTPSDEVNNEHCCRKNR